MSPMAEDRPRPRLQAGEREMLNGWLEFHRAVLLWKCEGLTDDQINGPPGRPRVEVAVSGPGQGSAPGPGQGSGCGRNGQVPAVS
jgi:Protein of unknown function (DUF664)